MWVAVVLLCLQYLNYLPPPVGHGIGIIGVILPSASRKEYYVVSVSEGTDCLTVSYGVKRGRNYAEK